ncbi:PREDICTED: ribonuclease H2 subunit B [Cyprinodon variegatus]|uniref:Ribonuclease H2 subunit B n=1 Tax=Cyprinodon variegatus TaxID=28743 RepID=A0A3Q2FIG1_CYPVA|nr:PREDICTED: ribonuclease H2 subunit B [Cyprinodon variegatus]
MATKKKRTPNSQNDSWVVIAADSVINTQKHNSDPDFVRLRNPSTGEASLYMFGSGDVQLYEVKAFEEDFHSWFVGQTVQRDGKLLFVTPMDPLYLILPYMIHSSREGKFQPVNQVVKDEDFPESSRLLRCSCSLSALHNIADEKEVGSQKFHRYSQERTLNWLKKKVEKTVVALKKKNFCVGEGVKSTTYVRVKTESDNQDEDYLRYAHGLISEYISEELSKVLLKHLGLTELKSPNETEPPSKKRKLSDKPVEAGEDYTKFNSADFARKPPKKMTTAQKTLAKVDKTGMKPMSSFFSPKTKAEKK